MSLREVVLLLLYCCGMTVGQLLFKRVSPALKESPAPLHEQLAALALNPVFLFAVAFYFALTVFWVWLLARLPLTKAYPFVALSFILTPASAAVLFGERLTYLNMVGLVLICVAVYFSAR
jgi:multidrug transporter EmrE-like cation transporter